MKITFPNKEQAKEAFENAKRFFVKYTWKMRQVKKINKNKDGSVKWFKNWLKKDEEMRKRRSGISRSANKSIDKKCIPSEVIKEAKKLIKTGRVGSEGIKHGLYDPRKQTLYERMEEVLVQIIK